MDIFFKIIIEIRKRKVPNGTSSQATSYACIEKKIKNSNIFSLRMNLNLAILLAINYLIAGVVVAEEINADKTKNNEIIAFDLPQNDLAKSLVQFGQQAQKTVIAPQAMIGGQRSSPVIGLLTPKQALQRLLQFTTLTFNYDDIAKTFKITVKEPVIHSIAEPDNAKNQNKKLSIEEVYITGIRGSLQKSLDIKRNATGIVDAISSVDLHRFPDTNLAESLQRITGVSIDRFNNEGNKVTVRGFGPDFNLVTLNGRQIPSSEITLFSDTSSPDSSADRSFSFSNLSTNGISHVEVHKTGQAKLPTGGIGSTINIVTKRPLDLPDTEISFGSKANFDTSIQGQKSAQPEFFGVFSKTFLDRKLGFLTSLSLQKRESRAEELTINGWVEDVTPNDIIIDERQIGNSNSWYPYNYGVMISDYARERVNGQTALQFSPSDKMVLTLDYTYAELSQEIQSKRFSTLFFTSPEDRIRADLNASLNENGTATHLVEETGSLEFSSFDEGVQNKNISKGINLEWSLQNNLKLDFDFHSSTANSGPKDDLSSTILAINTFNIEDKIFNIHHKIPSLNINFATPYSANNLEESFDLPFAYIEKEKMNNHIRQYQFKGEWDLDIPAISQINFGAAKTSVKNQLVDYDRLFLTHPDWESETTLSNYFNDSLYQVHSTANILDEFSPNLQSIPYFYSFDINEMIEATTRFARDNNFSPGFMRPVEMFNWANFTTPSTPGRAHSIKEETSSLYLEAESEFQVGDTHVTSLAGLRYERTHVNEVSQMIAPEVIRWVSSEMWQTVFAESPSYISQSSNYDVLLPSLDIRLDFAEDIKGHVSFSKTITRSDLAQMRSLVEVNAIPTPDARTASRGNPSLKPYTSNNLDFSLEWYYGNESYVALGLFHKNVKNFISTQITYDNLFGLTDVSQGPLADLAVAELEAEGLTVNDASVLARISRLQGGGVVNGSENDPLITWAITEPINAQSASLRGLEFALQHTFGESGWGTLVNFTKVDSNLAYDVASLGNSTHINVMGFNGGVELYNVKKAGYQFALPGQSDSLNLVMFYNKDRTQARIAYNWRDKFLSSLVSFTGNHPQFTEAYGQLDLSLSYDFNEHLSFFAEGINVLSENQRIYSRYQEQLISAKQLGSIYNIGFHWNF